MANRNNNGDIKINKKDSGDHVQQASVTKSPAKNQTHSAKMPDDEDIYISRIPKAKKTPQKENTIKPVRVDTSFSAVEDGDNHKKKKVKVPVLRMIWFILMLIISIFEIVNIVLIVSENKAEATELMMIFLVFLLVEWAYFFIFCVMFKRRMELEIIGFLFSFIGLAITASVYPDRLMTQFIAFLVGMGIYIVMLWFMENANRVTLTRLPMAAAALGMLALTLIIGSTKNGAKNWIIIGSFSIQPSELAKIAFIYVGAATLDKLQATRSLTAYIIFAAGCVGCLFLMYDFGTALIFFATFLLIAFMRSGDIRSIILICSAAVLGALLIVWFKPHVASRFENYRHIWESMDKGGFQQTRMLIYSLSGGLFGVGIGEGRLRYVYASTTDLAFGMVCEEFGLLMGILILCTFVFLALYTVKNAKYARSAFYSIAACAASGMILIQTALHVFGVTDLIPWTGVTLPFISRGGSSLMCAWGLLAFIKAADIRTYPKVMKELLQRL